MLHRVVNETENIKTFTLLHYINAETSSCELGLDKTGLFDRQIYCGCVAERERWVKSNVGGRKKGRGSWK